MNFKVYNSKINLFFPIAPESSARNPGKTEDTDLRKKSFPDCKILFPLYLTAS